MSKETKPLGTRAEAVSGHGVCGEPVSGLQRMSVAPPSRGVGLRRGARPGVPLRPVWGRTGAHAGSSPMCWFREHLATPGAPRGGPGLEPTRPRGPERGRASGLRRNGAGGRAEGGRPGRR